ncbi:MAG: phenylalanine--tRNA ligase subunit beta [bacterium]
MIVSWNWLREYLRLEMSVDQLSEKLALSGLNHESTEDVGGDLAIDLEVTSNRPDCLNHLGIAREIGVLFDIPVKWHNPEPQAKNQKLKVAELTRIENREPQLCPYFSARVIRGAKIGPSPWWLRKRLETLGVRPVSNVVDITNYVLFECGQPLHAYDLQKLAENRLIIRRANPGEELVAINGKTYKLHDKMLVIADAARPVALAGVMGGLETEISESTRDILIESARFQPVSVRNTSRELGLFSPSSYRFERHMDPERTDWANRRCAELILDLAGGQIAEGLLETRSETRPRASITLRLSQIEKVLGIRVEQAEVARILVRLGMTEQSSAEIGTSCWSAPSWRTDLDREIDLIEEVARVHGYEHIPEDRPVPLAVASRSRRERVENIVREVFTGQGLFEAINFSLVAESLALPVSGDLAEGVSPIKLEHSSRKKETTLRPSLAPSLLEARAYNQSHGNDNVALFEIAHAYLPQPGKALPDEPVRVAAVIGGDWKQAKGLAESLAARFHLTSKLSVNQTTGDVWSILDPERSAALTLGDRRWGVFGSLSKASQQAFDLRQPCGVVELDLSILIETAELQPQYAKLPDQPGVTRDLSLVVGDNIRWADVARLARDAGGPLLESVEYLDTFRGGKLASGTQSMHFGMTFRSPERTLSGDEADSAVHSIIERCKTELGASLRT